MSIDMGIIETIKETFGIGSASIRIHYYECQECGNQFESAKSPDRATCMECLSSEVDTISKNE